MADEWVEMVEVPTGATCWAYLELFHGGGDNFRVARLPLDVSQRYS